MKTSKYLLLFFCSLTIIACQSNKPAKPAHLRALTMIQNAPATLTIQGKGAQESVHQILSLEYAKPNGYQSLAPGHYEITLLVRGKELLKGSYVLGEDGYYTLLAAGLLPKNWEVNPQTVAYRLKHIFAGEELKSTNDYLPLWFMMRDNYDGSKESAYLRLVNANPRTTALTVKKDGESLVSGMAYPVESGMLKLDPQTYNLQAFYGGVSLGNKKINPKAGYIYTAVIGGKSSSGDSLTISVFENPSRTLLRSK